eukprot:CAMPEP_0184357722 /NCGR_PEP_ID=MMETSP1089-20130417/110469_1 /TAXON_ID=38269 ORGANISM="Gloeochaete wittrockiana, Strain SAG46.84" /NCGR_SAMPLE_ID=MMETSP1089 /ASSEMBLY_ACC=CAM_ASM_000445 /LENGTH=808 /DNA_ID=CAMNT_0026695651 /DNA_START=8 /DNA_END=2434 /DNA_ORIENTATION=+
MTIDDDDEDETMGVVKGQTQSKNNASIKKGSSKTMPFPAKKQLSLFKREMKAIQNSTVDDDDDDEGPDDEDPELSSDEGEEVVEGDKTPVLGAAEIDKAFRFEDPEAGWDFSTARADAIQNRPNARRKTSIAEKFEKVKRERNLPTIFGEEEIEEDLDGFEEEADEITERTIKKKGSKKKKEANVFALKAGGAKTTDEAVDSDEEDFQEQARIRDDDMDFSDLHLAKPFLKAIRELGWPRPTAIQRRSIPLLLEGKDICGMASTGSGKTGAFLLPILQRLYHLPIEENRSRVLILLPTRELAVQCEAMLRELTSHCVNPIAGLLLVGGMSRREQEAAVKYRPPILIATPGRLIDLIKNVQGFDLDDLEILVLDEADRLLDLGFKDEIEEIVKSCPTDRQTLLFSATMSKTVMSLANLSLKDPFYIAVNKKTQLPTYLTQEFLRIKKGRENQIEACLLAVCSSVYQKRTIIFCNQKITAHRIMLVMTVAGFKAGELHGDMNQIRRLESLDLFKKGQLDYLIATDVAARGLDIDGIEAVINFDMPLTRTQYIHRAGRTARAGKTGRCLSFVLESSRALLRDILKHTESSTPLKRREIPTKTIDKWVKKLASMEPSIAAVRDEEIVEKELLKAEMETNRVSNLIEHEKEIYSRPRKLWFQSEEQKAQAKENSRNAVKPPTEEEIARKKVKGKNNYARQEDDEPVEEHLSKRQLKKKKLLDAKANEKHNKVPRKKRRRMELEKLADQEREKEPSLKTLNKKKSLGGKGATAGGSRKPAHHSPKPSANVSAKKGFGSKSTNTRTTKKPAPRRK